MKILAEGCPYPISRELLELLETEIDKAELPDHQGICLNFRDPDYSVATGGFHPVEINLDQLGQISYITDFAYVGLAPFAELAKEIDFDFSLGIFQHFSREYPLSAGLELFSIWQDNFLSYVRMGVFNITLIRC